MSPRGVVDRSRPCEYGSVGGLRRTLAIKRASRLEPKKRKIDQLGRCVAVVSGLGGWFMIRPSKRVPRDDSVRPGDGRRTEPHSCSLEHSNTNRRHSDLGVAIRVATPPPRFRCRHSLSPPGFDVCIAHCTGREPKGLRPQYPLATIAASSLVSLAGVLFTFV